MEFVAYGAVGFLGGLIGALCYRVLFVKVQVDEELATSAVSHARESTLLKPKKIERRFVDIDVRLKKLEEEAKQKSSDRKIDHLGEELRALDENVVRPMRQQLDALRFELADLRPMKLEVEWRRPLQQRGEQPPLAAPIVEKTPEEPTRILHDIAQERVVSGGHLPDMRSPGEIIVTSFDDVDASTLRRIEGMKQEYARRLGSLLVDLYERNGAYVFLMNDDTAYVHPKPNSPLPRAWERAFLGAASYSRPIRRVHKAALIRQPEGDYEVIEKGEVQVT
jgi:hypothetical protein